MKIWRPDTCHCVIEELYQGTEIVGSGEIIHKCDAHQDVADEDLWSAIIAEQQPIGETLHAFLTAHPQYSQKGEGKVLLDGISLKKEFEGTGYDRKAILTFEGAHLTKGEKELVTDTLDSSKKSRVELR